MAMMNPELAALLGQGQTAPSSVAGSPVVSAIQKLMGAGGSAPPMPQGDPNQMLEDRTRGRSGQGNGVEPAMPQSTAPNPAATEEELAMAQKMMGAPREDVPMPRPNRLRQMQDHPEDPKNDLRFEGNRRSGPTSQDRAVMDEIPTDGVMEDAERRFGRKGMDRR